MEDEELPSESTSRPIFRRNINKIISPTDARAENSSSSKVLKKKVKSTPTTTKRISTKAKKKLFHEKKKSYPQSTRKSKTSSTTTAFDNFSSTDDDMYDNRDPTPVQKPRSNKSSTRKINIHVEENLINLDDSLASDKTDNDEPNPESNIMSKTTNKTKDDVWKYFIQQSNEEIKCILCPTSSKSFPKTNKSSDSNLRSHLGRTHKLIDFLYPSQRPMVIELPKKDKTISDQQKKRLDTAAIEAIIEDSHSFGVFRKPGMQKFLSLAVPGYRGPNRRTVVKRLKSMYKERRSIIRDDLSSVSDISLSADLWKSIRRDHFVCLSAHYYDDNYQLKSHVIAFRRFLGSHYSDRIEQFITNEVEKLNIQTKIRSLTTDNGSDIRSATQNKSKFGIRISCLIHVLNLVVKNGMWLFKIPKGQNTTSSSITNTISSTITILNNTKSNPTSSKPSAIKSNTTSSKTTTTKSNATSSSSKNTKSNSTLSSLNNTNLNSILSTSSTTETNGTTVTFTESSTEDDDYDSIMDDDEVSDEVSDDNKSDITNEDSDVDRSSDNISIISSLVDNRSNSSSLGNDTDYENLNTSLPSTITDEEEFLYQSFIDPSILLLKIHILLKHIRQIVTMIRNISALNRYVVKEIKLHLENLNRQREAENKKKIKYKEFTLDMKIRWNSSYVMLSRFVFHSSIIISLTHNPPKEINLKPSQCRKLKKLSFTSLDWSILKALEHVLAPFNRSTKILLTRRRPTMAISQSVIYVLRTFLTVDDNAPLTLENLLKNQLLLNLNFYFNKHVSDEQCKAILISSFLDPTTYQFLTCNDKKEAETIIINEAKQHYAKLNSQSLSSSNQSSMPTSSNKDEQDNQTQVLHNFFMACGIAPQTTSPNFKPSSIKEEIAQYIATITHHPTFSQYWKVNKDRLRILSSFVRQYNIMCPTSIHCESAFSIAGYIHRKNRSALAPASLRYSMILREQIKNIQK